MNAVRLMIVAVGGQGNLLTAKMIGEAALAAGLPFQMSEIHGMAQRGGVVESAIIIGDAHSSLIADGEADILLGFEPLETLRAIKKCNKNTVVITSTSPLPPSTSALGITPYPAIDTILETIRSRTPKLSVVDGMALARKAGNALALNMVMLGALARSKLLPLPAEHLREAVNTLSGKNFATTNLKAFDLGLTEEQTS